jgi:hypothetical protein
MPNKNNTPLKTTREWRQRYVRMLKVEAGEIDPPGTKYPTPPRRTTQAQRRRIVEVLALEAGLPLPKWGSTRSRPEPIDETPWAASRAASLRAQHQRLGRYGLALSGDGAIRCVKCKEVVLAVPRGRAFAIGAPISLLAARHQEEGCR